MLAPFVPSNAVATLASEGIAAFVADEVALESLKGQKVLTLPAPSQWGDRVEVVADAASLEVSWLATGMERTWTHAGSARVQTKSSPKSASSIAGQHGRHSRVLGRGVARDPA